MWLQLSRVHWLCVLVAYLDQRWSKNNMYLRVDSKAVLVLFYVRFIRILWDLIVLCVICVIVSITDPLTFAMFLVGLIDCDLDQWCKVSWENLGVVFFMVRMVFLFNMCYILSSNRCQLHLLLSDVCCKASTSSFIYTRKIGAQLEIKYWHGDVGAAHWSCLQLI